MSDFPLIFEDSRGYLRLEDETTTDSHITTSSRAARELENGYELTPLGESLSSPQVVYELLGDTQFARVDRGLWKNTMLIDRTLRGMATLTTVFALVLLGICFAYIREFVRRPNPHSTSVDGDTDSCHSVAWENRVFHLLINAAATMILGMSNTYQQLITSLKAKELKAALHAIGDVRCGINSPFSINHKEKGKVKSWLAWLLLIFTSLPVHFLGNSLVGPSYIVVPPEHTIWNSTTTAIINSTVFLFRGPSFTCWTAFRTGTPHFSAELPLFQDGDYMQSWSFSDLAFFSSMVVHYDEADCGQYANNTSLGYDEIMSEKRAQKTQYEYKIGNCSLGSNVDCRMVQSTEAPGCRLNIRMQAAVILALSITAKAVYMVCVNIRSRSKIKENCLTFGDVVVASALDSGLRIRNECLVNAGECHRQDVQHTCHSHCEDKAPSDTGDSIGHCQHCGRFNTVDRAASLPQPTMATKFKKSLLSSLGHTALTQVVILFFISICMVTATIFTLVGAITVLKNEQWIASESSWARRLTVVTGGWGGFNQSVSILNLKPDSIGSEFGSMAISNGAQFIYSWLYLLVIYNATLIGQERDWGKLEKRRGKLRCTIVKGSAFEQSYLLQLPKEFLVPLMAFSILMHWLLGQSISSKETVWRDLGGPNWSPVEHSRYTVTAAAYPIWLSTVLMILMTAGCWWAFTYTREGFIPTMFGSVRVLCASTTGLTSFAESGIQWGDLGEGGKFRHAGLSSSPVGKIHPNELYSGSGL